MYAYEFWLILVSEINKRIRKTAVESANDKFLSAAWYLFAREFGIKHNLKTNWQKEPFQVLSIISQKEALLKFKIDWGDIAELRDETLLQL